MHDSDHLALLDFLRRGWDVFAVARSQSGSFRLVPWRVLTALGIAGVRGWPAFFRYMPCKVVYAASWDGSVTFRFMPCGTVSVLRTAPVASISSITPDSYTS